MDMFDSNSESGKRYKGCLLTKFTGRGHPMYRSSLHLPKPNLEALNRPREFGFLIDARHGSVTVNIYAFMNSANMLLSCDVFFTLGKFVHQITRDVFKHVSWFLESKWVLLPKPGIQFHLPLIWFAIMLFIPSYGIRSPCKVRNHSSTIFLAVDRRWCFTWKPRCFRFAF